MTCRTAPLPHRRSALSYGPPMPRPEPQPAPAITAADCGNRRGLSANGPDPAERFWATP